MPLFSSYERSKGLQRYFEPSLKIALSTDFITTSGKTCDFAHAPEELRNFDGSPKGQFQVALRCGYSVLTFVACVGVKARNLYDRSTSITTSKVTATSNAEESNGHMSLGEAPPPAALALSQEDSLSWKRLTSVRSNPIVMCSLAYKS